MGRRLNVFMAIFIAVIMVSSYGAIAFLGDKDDTIPPDSDFNASDIEDFSLKQYSASGVEATIDTVFPQIILTADTNVLELSELDSLVYNSGSIRNINSRFLQPQPGVSSTGTFLYVANITLEPDSDSLKVLELLKENTFPSLVNFQPVLVGLVRLPETVTLTNNELVTEIEHSFENPLTEAYLSTDARKGDLVLVSLDTTFRGEILAQVIATEEQNLTAKLNTITLKRESTLTELLPELVFEADLNYSFIKEQETLESDFNALPELTGSSIKLFELFPSLTITFLSLPVEQDVNNVLTSNSLITDFAFYDFNNLIVLADFNSDLVSDINLLKQGLVNDFNSLGFDSNSYYFTEPQARIHALLYTNSTDLLDFSNFLSTNFLPKLNFDFGNIKQKANVVEKVFFDLETDANYLVDSNSIAVLVSPSHAVNDSVLFNFNLVVKRNQVLVVDGTEEGLDFG
ncbi:MAG: hypothetical protein ABH821_02580 [archaeon]